MKGDYKFWYITREDDGTIREAAVRFYEGDITSESELEVLTGITSTVTRYRRTKKLKLADLPHIDAKKVKKDIANQDVFLYTKDDFGVISDDDELRAFLNKEMKKDTTRDNIDEQVEEDVEKLKKLKIK